MENKRFDRKSKPGFGEKKDFGGKRFEKKEFGAKKFDKKDFGGKKSDKKNFDKPNFSKSRDFANKNKFEDEDDFRSDKLEGRNPVLEALKSERTIDKILVQKGQKEGSINQIIAIAKERGIVVSEVERAKLDEISFTHSHQGVIAFVSEHDYVEVEDILEYAKSKGEQPFIVILDEITDPHNLGSIIRSANACGVHGIIIPKRRAVGLNSIVAKTSAGAIEYVHVAKVANVAQTIEQLKKQGLWILGADGEAKKAFYDSDLKGPIGLVIGSEGEGMSRLVKESCDFLLKIPMKGEISSFNASVAAAIIMFEASKQRM